MKFRKTHEKNMWITSLKMLWRMQLPMCYWHNGTMSIGRGTMHEVIQFSTLMWPKLTCMLAFLQKCMLFSLRIILVAFVQTISKPICGHDISCNQPINHAWRALWQSLLFSKKMPERRIVLFWWQTSHFWQKWMMPVRFTRSTQQTKRDREIWCTRH